jgi:hypothetical protein
MHKDSTRSLDVEEAGAGTAVKSTARSTMILLQGFGVPMRRTSTASVVERRTDSRKKTIVGVDTVVIVQRDGEF